MFLYNLPQMDHWISYLRGSTGHESRYDFKPNAPSNTTHVYLFSFQNYHRKTDPLPMCCRGAKHILMGFFGTVKFPVLVLLLFLKVFRNELLCDLTKISSLILPVMVLQWIYILYLKMIFSAH